VYPSRWPKPCKRRGSLCKRPHRTKQLGSPSGCCCHRSSPSLSFCLLCGESAATVPAQVCLSLVANLLRRLPPCSASCSGQSNRVLPVAAVCLAVLHKLRCSGATAAASQQRPPGAFSTPSVHGLSSHGPSSRHGDAAPPARTGDRSAPRSLVVVLLAVVCLGVTDRQRPSKQLPTQVSVRATSSLRRSAARRARALRVSQPKTLNS
jgi:hypothetical protein